METNINYAAVGEFVITLIIAATLAIIWLSSGYSFQTHTTYLIYLHMRLVMGWRGRKTAYLSLIGFLVVIGTYVGVNYLSPLHGFLSNTGK